MIVFVVTSDHAYTLKDVAAADSRVVVQSYRWLLTTRTVPHATYIFGDFDRLTLWQLRLAAAAYRQLRDHGLRLLNDPAKAKSRFGLLRHLFRTGLNGFNAYRAEEGVKPQRWPVFLRSEGDHLGPGPRLFQRWEDLERAIIDSVENGIPLQCLLIVEYAAEPVEPGLFRKLSVTRIGGQSIGHPCVHDRNWVVKLGTKGIASPALYEDELRQVRDNPFGAALARVFDIGGFDYGRVDFGLVQGRPQIYEINDNPTVHLEPTDHPSPLRRQSERLFAAKYLTMLRSIDTPDDGAPVELSLPTTGGAGRGFM